MKTQFVTVELQRAALPDPPPPAQLRSAIESALLAQGQPLRWAIVAADAASWTIEAVIIQPDFSVATKIQTV